MIPTNPSARRQRRPVAKALIVAGALLLLFVIGFIGLRAYQLAKFLREPHPPTPGGEFYSATARIGPLGETASGNSIEAAALAEDMAGAMATIRKKHFTPSKEKSLVDQHDAFKAFCDLRPGQCVFLIHVPELRRFDGNAQTLMGNYAWKAAQEVLKHSTGSNQPVRLGVGMRGVIAYERVLLGRYPADGGEVNLAAPEVQQGFGCERRLIDWFAPPETNSAPAF